MSTPPPGTGGFDPDQAPHTPGGAPYHPGQQQNRPLHYGPSAYSPLGHPPEKSKKGLIVGGIIAVAVALIIILIVALIGRSSGVSKREYQEGLEELITTSVGDLLSDEEAKNISSCITDKTFDEASEQTREAIADAQDVMPGNEDFELIQTASTQCTMDNLSD